MLDEPVDEFVCQHVSQFLDKKLVNIGKSGFELPNDDEQSKKIQRKIKSMYKPLTEYWQKEMSSSLSGVTISTRLIEEPLAIVSSEYGQSANVEKMQRVQQYQRTKTQQNQMMDQSQSKKVLELNAAHPIIKDLLQKVNEQTSLNEDLTDLIHILTLGALVNSGYSLDNTQEFQKRLNRQVFNLMAIPKDTPVEELNLELEEEDEQNQPDS